MNFIQVTSERQSQDQKEVAVKSTVKADFISSIVENRYSGTGKGSILLLQDGESMRVQESFEELNTRLPHRLLLKQVAPAGRDSLHVSIHPEQIRLVEGTRFDGRGTPDGSRLTFKNQNPPIYVSENTGEITERLAVLDDKHSAQRATTY